MPLSITSAISVTSDRIRDRFDGFTLENARAGYLNNKSPIPAGTYDAFVRTFSGARRSPRIELLNVPGYSNIQLHKGNFSSDLNGCFVPGETRKTDYVGQSGFAMSEMLRIIGLDGTGSVKVNDNFAFICILQVFKCAVHKLSLTFVATPGRNEALRKMSASTELSEGSFAQVLFQCSFIPKLHQSR